jgi:hypothetical protein
MFVITEIIMQRQYLSDDLRLQNTQGENYLSSFDCKFTVAGVCRKPD